MYIPAGQSDDWMVTQRLYIGDDTYRLKFKSQSYRKDKEDILKVIVRASDDVVTALTPAIVNSFRYQGNVVYEKRQDAGANEAIMVGEWTENEISLKDFAGKNIYVAFVNNNNNQSAIFLDDVEVSRDLDLSIALFTPEYLVGKDEMEVSGHMQNLSSNNIDELTLNLKAADGSVVDKMELKGLGLKPNGLYQFKFGKNLPIAASAETYYSVELVYGGRTTSVRQSVKNLAFQTTRRVVLEEYTGTTCGYCPRDTLSSNASPRTSATGSYRLPSTCLRRRTVLQRDRTQLRPFPRTCGSPDRVHRPSLHRFSSQQQV